jgi:hypothetical protein
MELCQVFFEGFDVGSVFDRAKRMMFPLGEVD